MTYIVKVVATATEDNPNFKGEVHTHFIDREGYVYDLQESAMMNGWKKRWAAEKFIKEMKEWLAERRYYWTDEYEIIEE